MSLQRRIYLAGSYGHCPSGVNLAGAAYESLFCADDGFVSRFPSLNGVMEHMPLKSNDVVRKNQEKRCFSSIFDKTLISLPTNKETFCMAAKLCYPLKMAVRDGQMKIDSSPLNDSHRVRHVRRADTNQTRVLGDRNR
jgi:hypothetical protein